MLEIERTTKLLEDSKRAWKDAGAPNILQAELATAKDKATELYTHFRRANRDRRITSLKIAYSKIARFARNMSARLRLPPLAFSALGGAAIFALASLLALLWSNRPSVIFTTAAIVFLFGFFALACLQRYPNGNDLPLRITTLEQQKSAQLEPLTTARLAYEALSKNTTI